MALKNKNKVVVNLPHEDAEKLREIAQAEDRTVTGLIRLAITAYLAGRETPAPAPQ